MAGGGLSITNGSDVMAGGCLSITSGDDVMDRDSSSSKITKDIAKRRLSNIFLHV
ncbi:MAG TPA: hypothetical protein VK048_04445 [Atopostipes sp.]|nr:hypothetical protein [Atopostipes sp.]